MADKFANIQNVESKKKPESRRPGKMRHFLKTAVLAGTISLLSMSLSAQNIASESGFLRHNNNDTARIVAIFTWLYRGTAANEQEKTVNLEYMFGKKITIPTEPTEDLELGKGIWLSIDNQKYLKRYHVMHTQDYALFYSEYIYDGGEIHVCKKKYGK